MIVISSFGAALFGAAFQELIHWNQLRKRLDSAAAKKLWSSSGYWVITVLMIIGSAAGSVLWFSEHLAELGLQHFVLTGAAFPVLFKAAVSTAGSDETTLGEATPEHPDPAAVGRGKLSARELLGLYFVNKKSL